MQLQGMLRYNHTGAGYTLTIDSNEGLKLETLFFQSFLTAANSLYWSIIGDLFIISLSHQRGTRNLLLGYFLHLLISTRYPLDPD